MISSIFKSIFAVAVVCIVAIGCAKKEVKPDTNGEFVLENTKFSGECLGIASKVCKDGNDVAITSKASLIVYNMPAASTGIFNITNGWAANPGCNVYVLLQKADGTTTIASINGTLTKTGEKTFTILVNMTDFPTAASATTVSGSGTYKILD